MKKTIATVDAQLSPTKKANKNLDRKRAEIENMDLKVWILIAIKNYD